MYNFLFCEYCVYGHKQNLLQVQILENVEKSKKLVDDITNKTLEVLNEVLAKYKIVNVIAIKNSLVSTLSQYIYDEIEHRPFIVPIVTVM